MALDVKNLCIFQRRTDGVEVPLVQDLSFSLERGQTLALCGSSGCGKTSVALSLIDLLPAGLRRDQGLVSIDGEPFSRSWRGARIGYVFQEPSKAFHPLFTVGNLMAERLKLAGVVPARAKSESIKWLERIGLADPEARLKDQASRFSGGELQRIMIAMTLAQNPEYVVADEPTSNLDVLVQGKILSLLQSLQSEFDLGLLLITHDSRVAKSMTDAVISMPPLVQEGESR
ncbi:MAG: peptide/nickel transport system ATP-binding protein [Planctomycetota bacterium]|jgi:peptide/nickel transport system ATP-binding protein